MQSAVLLIAFNRPETTRKVLEAVRLAQPSRFYFAVDGPRSSSSSDVQGCEKVRQLAQLVDWPCELLTRFQTENQGLAKHTVGAISWFLENEREGIVLEDDGVPEPSFFTYCDELLEHFRDSKNVGHIAGTSFFQRPLVMRNQDYSLTRSANAWGFALWRRSWLPFIDFFETFRGRDQLPDFKRSIPFWRFTAGFWSGVMSDIEKRRIDSWAYLWQISLWERNFLAVMPAVNLVRNIGFGGGATHTSRKPIVSEFYPASGPIPTPLTHPPKQEPSVALDFLYQLLYVGAFGRRVRTIGRLIFAAINRLWMLFSTTNK